MIDDLMDVSRVTKGKISISKERIDVAVLVARAIESCRGGIDARGHELRSNLQPGTLYVEVDATRIEQVICNVLTNASKYTEPGGLLKVCVDAVEGCACIRIHDNGVGISREMLPHIFELFTQADRSLAHSQGGLGIGLALAKSLVEIHGGKISIHSPGLSQGTQVTIKLPLCQVQMSEVVIPPKFAPFTKNPGPRRVIMVDDNRDFVETMRSLLTAAGHEVKVAYDGNTGWELIRNWRAHVIFLDIGLPGLDGYQIVERAKELGLDPAPVIVALTGYGDEDTRARIKSAGFDEHFVKPVDPDRVLHRVHNATI